MNSGVCVGSVPSEVGTCFLAARAPASAITGTLTQNRPTNITSPSKRFMVGLFAPNPANALPLLFDADENAYSACENPCGNGFVSEDETWGVITAIAVTNSTERNGASTEIA